MNLLKAVAYDPTTAVTKGTVASAMAAFDTTNARLAFVVPPSGCVRVYMQCVVHGATTFSQILLGVMNGVAVVAKVVPVGSMNGTPLAVTMMSQVADFVVSGLTPGASVNWDMAWGIETFVTASLIKYGGPANSTANNDFGALVFQVWDPCPVYTPTAGGAAPTTALSTRQDTIQTKTDFLPSATAGAAGGVQIAGANAATTYATLTSTGAFTVSGVANVSQTGDSFNVVKATGAGDNAAIKAKTDLIPAAPASTTNITAGTITTVTNLTNAPTAGDLTATMKTSVTTAATAATPIAASVTGAVGSVTGAVGSVTAAVTLPSIPANWITAAGINASALNGKGDWNIGKTGYSLTQAFPANFSALLIAPVTGYVTTVGGVPLDAAGTRTALGLATANLDTQLGTLLTSAAYTAPDNVSVTAIKAKTDGLAFTVANKLDVNLLVVNGVTIGGSGTTGSPWGPV